MTHASIVLPRLYPIPDAGLLAARGIPLEAFARALREQGVRFLQYRDKDGSDAEMLEQARMLRRIFPAPECTLILNDRPHLCAAAGFDGLHVGQEDLPPAAARAIVGPGRVLGVSTHNPEQIRAADASGADYVAIGPVYGTASKANPDPVVGLEGVRAARGLTAKPLVAIGGITRSNCAAAIDAGADSVAVISGLLPAAGAATAEAIRDFLAVFR